MLQHVINCITTVYNKYQKEQKHQNSQISSEGICFGTDFKDQAHHPRLPPGYLNMATSNTSDDADRQFSVSAKNIFH